MKTCWINKQNNDSCILFFNGWGMDKNAICHLDKGDFDVCMLYDFNPISTINEDLKDYKEVYLVAWSLGVWAAACCFSKSAIKLSKAIALNGTQKPIDNEFGISAIVFSNTLNTWNEANRSKFNMRMLGGRTQYEEHLNCLTSRTAENQQEELKYIQQEVESKGLKEITFDTVLIGSKDLIFTVQNQYNYWSGKTKIVEADVPHFPFSIFNSWQEIIDL